MRRKTAKTLANLGRLAGVAVCTLAGITAVVWTWSPMRILELEQRLSWALIGDLHDSWKEAQAETDPARQRQLLQRLLGRLQHVQGQDYLAEIVTGCQLRLATLAEADGNPTEAAQWLRHSVAFDDHDLRTQARLGDLLCRVEATRAEGFTLLDAWAKRFPANPNVTPVLVRNLIDAGRAEAALAVLDSAHGQAQSNLWSILWDTGSDLEHARAAIIPSMHGGILRLRFDLVDKSRSLRFLLPCFASVALAEPKLTVEVQDKVHTIDLLGPAATLNQVEHRGSHLEAVGNFEATIDVALPDLPPGPCRVTFEAIALERRSRLLAEPTLLAGMGALRDELAKQGRIETLRRLQLWRQAACSGSTMQCFFAEAQGAFDGSRRVSAVIECPGDDRFEVTFAVHKPAGQLRLDLPPGMPRLEYRCRTLEVMVDGRWVVFDALSMPLLGSHELQRANGAFTSTGRDPYFSFAAPSGQQVEAVRLRGVL